MQGGVCTGVGIRHKSGCKSIGTGAFTRAFDDDDDVRMYGESSLYIVCIWGVLPNSAALVV